MKGILGKKIGMTGIFAQDGELIPVTVISVTPNVVIQIKTMEKDGYNSIQLGFDEKRKTLMNKPSLGHQKKAKTEPKRFLREIRNVSEEYKVGDILKADVFSAGELVDVTGISKGKGMQGVIKRYNFSIGPMSHGSRFHRSVGSLGNVQSKRVFKGKKMPGHMGNEQVTVQNLEVVQVDVENNVILVKGSIPGPKKSLVVIKTSVKKPEVKKTAKDIVTYGKE